MLKIANQSLGTLRLRRGCTIIPSFISPPPPPPPSTSGYGEYNSQSTKQTMDSTPVNEVKELVNCHRGFRASCQSPGQLQPIRTSQTLFASKTRREAATSGAQATAALAANGPTHKEIDLP